MARLLLLVVSGPESAARAIEGLGMARSIGRMDMLESVRVLLTGPGVRCLDPDDPEAEPLRDAVEDLLAAGVEVATCTRSLADTGLVEAAQALEGLRIVGAPTHLAALVAEGYTIATF